MTSDSLKVWGLF